MDALEAEPKSRALQQVAYYRGVPGKPVREKQASKSSQLQGNSGGEFPLKVVLIPIEGAGFLHPTPVSHSQRTSSGT